MIERFRSDRYLVRPLGIVGQASAGFDESSLPHPIDPIEPFCEARHRGPEGRGNGDAFGVDRLVQLGDRRCHPISVKLEAASSLDPRGVRDAVCDVQHGVRISEPGVQNIGRRDRLREQCRESHRHIGTAISRECRDLQPALAYGRQLSRLSGGPGR